MLLGFLLMLAGFLLSLTVIGALIGIPLFIVGILLVFRGLFSPGRDPGRSPCTSPPGQGGTPCGRRDPHRHMRPEPSIVHLESRIRLQEQETPSREGVSPLLFLWAWRRREVRAQAVGDEDQPRQQDPLHLQRSSQGTAQERGTAQRSE